MQSSRASSLIRQKPAEFRRTVNNKLTTLPICCGLTTNTTDAGGDNPG